MTCSGGSFSTLLSRSTGVVVPEAEEAWRFAIHESKAAVPTRHDR